MKIENFPQNIFYAVYGICASVNQQSHFILWHFSKRSWVFSGWIIREVNIWWVMLTLTCLSTHYLPYMHTHACTYTHIHAPIHAHTRMHIHTHSHTYTCTHTHAHTHTFTHIYMHTHACTYTHIHAHTHTCTYTFTHLYTHTYVHTIHTVGRDCPPHCSIPGTWRYCWATAGGKCWPRPGRRGEPHIPHTAVIVTWCIPVMNYTWSHSLHDEWVWLVPFNAPRQRFNLLVISTH